VGVESNAVAYPALNRSDTGGRFSASIAVLVAQTLSE
jgi:hypothetical protein